MKTYRKTARMIGALFLIAMVASLVGGTIVNSIISTPEPLDAVSQNESQLLFGVFLEILNALAVVGIAILMFAIIKEHNETMAVGYLSFRVIESLFCVFIVITPLTLLSISQNFSGPGNLTAVSLEAVSAISNAIRAVVVDWFIPIFFSLGALVLYTFLYRSKRLPRFVAIWGFIAAVLIVLLVVLRFLNMEVGISLNMVIALPIILNEIFMGIWLIAKGFKPLFPAI